MGSRLLKIDNMHKTALMTLFIGSVLFGSIQNKTNHNADRPQVSQNKIRFDGVYTHYDLSIGNCGAPAYELYEYISPILFFEDGIVMQSPHCHWRRQDFITGLKSNNERIDSGTFTYNGNEIVIEGDFTFFARGHDWKHYKAKYEGYLDPSGDTLFLRLAKPYPPVKLKFNKNLVRQIEEGVYEKYIFKPLPKHDLQNIDQDFLDTKRKRYP